MSNEQVQAKDSATLFHLDDQSQSYLNLLQQSCSFFDIDRCVQVDNSPLEYQSTTLALFLDNTQAELLKNHLSCIGLVKNAYSASVIVVGQYEMDTAIEATSILRPLGFVEEPISVFQALGLRAFKYDIASYNKPRSWNNPKYWANPENFKRFRW